MPLTDPLTNARSERVAGVRALGQRAARLRTSRYVAEGPQSVREAVRYAAADVRDIYVTQQASSRWPEIVDAALDAGLYVHPTSTEALERMSADAQGVLAVLDLRASDLSALDLGRLRLVAVCEEVRDPGNAGTIIRAADAAGADAVVLTTGSVEVTSPKVVRSSAGSVFHLPVISGVGLADVVSTLRGAGLDVLAADGQGEHDIESTSLLDRPTAWIFGNEAHGLSDDARALADATVRVPLRGRAESLNVAMAATITLYASSLAHARSR
ncbi:TrmH family RNA methyltransferase [Miniimonas sp. S16]|uniref:TrmH family RNA methyltransferase n=1 Tax=Miniimonas sp. S16 TaxID=2171623 RepID=UPI00351A0EDA